MTSLEHLITRLSAAFLAGSFERDSILKRSARLFRRPPRWVSALVDRILVRFPGGVRPARRRLIEFLKHDPGLQTAHDRYSISLKDVWFSEEFSPAPGCVIGPQLPPLSTIEDLADWLRLEIQHLDWFADRRSLERIHPDGPRRHYRYRWVCKRGGQVRLIEAPKPVLKALQRQILDQILSLIPPHESVHGFCSGRSVKSFVARHTGQTVVLKMDLKDFFPSLHPARLTALLMRYGYPEEVARTITALCSNYTPPDVWESFPLRHHTDLRWNSERLYQRPHFPQGSPASPAIANLCAFHFDCRLAGLARAAGAVWTRYADDLLFSGDQRFARQVDRFQIQVATIALEEGFEVNHHKTRIMRQGVQQRAAGVVLNQKPNVARSDFDRLKALLHRVVTRGVQALDMEDHSDFKAHLAGRIGWVAELNPRRAVRLRKLFDQIEWPANGGLSRAPQGRLTMPD